MTAQMMSEGRSSPYQDPQLATWLGSFEGVPEWPEPKPSAQERSAQTGWQQRTTAAMNWAGVLMPGLALALLLAMGGGVVARWVGQELLGYDKSPLSPILVAVVLGLLVRNVLGLPDVYEKGLRLCVVRVLRAGIVLLGIGMSLAAVGSIGLLGLPIILACITVALVAVTWINNTLGLPRRLGSLIAVGTSICGVSAIVATAPVIDADDDETSYAVATIALFGMIALFLYPFLAHVVFADQPKLAGMFLGTAIHDTSQVAGAALTYQQQYSAPVALNSAVVTKLARNLCMIGVIPLMGMLYHRGRESDGRAKGAKPGWQSMVPLFVVAFLAMTLLRTVGDLSDRPFGILSNAQWQSVIGYCKSAAEWCLAIAMAAVGLGTSLQRLRKLGIKPLCVGFAAALFVGGASMVMLKLFVS